MTALTTIWLWVLAGYLAGSIPFGLLLTRAAGLGDIRAIGSGNIGATNVLRTGRKGLAAATLLLDALKAAVVIWIGGLFAPDAPALIGVAAFLGHLYPLWLRFRGGKGVATYLGVALALAWPVFVAAALTWLAVAALFRFSSLAALVAVLVAPAAAYWLGRFDVAASLAGMAVLVWLKHAANLQRLLSGAEPRIGAKKAPAP